MGLDLALGGLVLIIAIRGWLKGFLIQAIRLAGLVSAVYVAAPVRDEAKPYVLEYLPTMRPELVDRLLWWSSAAASYFVLVGAASLLLAVSRRQTFGLTEAQRGDQFAGFGLGFVKGLIVASFLLAGLQKYGQPHLTRVAWAEEQAKESMAWEWNERYRPAARLWATIPVQHFVGHIQKMGLMSPGASAKPASGAETSVQTASRTPRLAISSTRPQETTDPDLDTSELDPELARTVESIQRQLQALETPD